MFPAGWQEGPRRGHLKRSSRARSFQVPYLRTRVPRHQETSGKNTQGRLFENVPTSKCNQTFESFYVPSLKSSFHTYCLYSHLCVQL